MASVSGPMLLNRQVLAVLKIDKYKQKEEIESSAAISEVLRENVRKLRFISINSFFQM